MSKSCSTCTGSALYVTGKIYLERVPLVAQTLLLFFPELVQAIVVPVIIHELMVPLGTSLADLFADVVQLLAWLYNT